MGLIRSLIVALKADTKGFDKGMAKASKSVAAFTKTAKGIATALTGITGALSVGGVGLAIAKQFKALDDLAKNAQRIGVTTEAYAGLAHAAELTGNRIETMIPAIQKMQKALAEGTKNDVLKNLGLDPAALAKASPDQAFLSIAGAIAEVHNPAQRAAAAMQLFEESGANLMPLFNQGAEGIAKMMQEAKELGIAFTGLDTSKIEEANGAITRMKAAFGGLAGQLAVAVAPEIEAIANKVVTIAQTIGRLQGASPGRTAIDVGASPAIQNPNDATARIRDLSERAQALVKENNALLARQEELQRLRGSAPGHSSIVTAMAEAAANSGRMDQIAAAIHAINEEFTRLVKTSERFNRIAAILDAGALFVRDQPINTDLGLANFVQTMRERAYVNPFDAGTQSVGNFAADTFAGPMSKLFDTAAQAAGIEMERRAVSAESAARRAADQLDIESQLIRGVEAAADRWRDAIATPLDQFKNDAAEISAALAAGLLTGNQADAAFNEAARRAREATANDPRLPQALERGSSELISALNRDRAAANDPTQQKLAEQIDLARQQLRKAEDANVIFEEIRDAVESGVVEAF